MNTQVFAINCNELRPDEDNNIYVYLCASFCICISCVHNVACRILYVNHQEIE